VDLELISKILKLLQTLLKQEVSYFEQRKLEEMRIVAMAPLISFLVETVSMSTLNDPSNLPLIGYKLLPGLAKVIALIKQTFSILEGIPEGAEGSQQQAARLGSLNLLDSL